MTTIDLAAAPAGASTAPAGPAEPFEGVPRRVGLTLPELTHLTATLGAPLPFEVTAAAPESGLDARLGRSRPAGEDAAYDAALAALRALGSPESALVRRGLIDDGGRVERGVAGALGLLATPSAAVDLDVAIGSSRAHAWHRHNASGVATLATADGLVFEVSWFPVESWPAEIARTAALPEDTGLRSSRVPDHVEVPFTLADSVLEALRAGRGDLVPLLTDGDATLTAVLTALGTETRGRLRALTASVTAADAAPIGVVSWVLVADGWRALRPETVDGELRLIITRVAPADLATELAPVLAKVTQ